MQSTKQEVTVQTNLLIILLNNLQRVLHGLIRITQVSLNGCRDYIEMGFFGSKCSSTARLDGKTAVITGCNTGIGKATAKDLFQRGARVVMACRNLKAANEALEDIKKQSADCQNCGELRVTELDLSSLESVRRCAQDLLKNENKINLLINNAGVICPFSKTKDGYEMQFGTNHLGHFLLTLLLLPKIIQSKPARIVNVSSIAHIGGRIDFDDINSEKKFYALFGAYAQSKLANVLFTKELDRRLKQANIHGINTYCLHPGLIATDMGRHFNFIIPGVDYWYTKVSKLTLKSPEQGAQTTIYCAIDEKCENESGLYYSECRVKEPSNVAKDENIAKRLWEVSCKLVQLDENQNSFKREK